MATATESAAVTQKEFHDSAEYRSLTQKQMRWIDTLLESGDPTRATCFVYAVENGPYASMLTGKLQSSPRIIAALNLFYGRSPKECFLLDLERTIASESGPAKVAAMRMYSRLKFGDESENPEPSETTERIVIQNGARFRITATRIGDAESTESR
jgi:hypothetical protein